MIKWFNLLGGRKLLIVLLFTAIGIAMQFLSKFDNNFSMFLLGLAGIFAAGNSVEHIMNKNKEGERDV